MAAFDPNETTTLPQTPDVQQAGSPAPADAAATPDVPAVNAQPPAAAAQPAQPPAPPEPQDLKQLDVFRDPNKLAQAAEIFLSHGDQTGLKWLEHVHTALRENAVEAIGHLQAGNGDEAVKAFNKSGMFQNAKDATKNDDGTWTLTTDDGKSQTIDPNQEAAALMSPEAYQTLQLHKQTAAATIAAEKAHAAYWTGINDSREQVAGIRANAALEVQRLKDEVAKGGMQAAAAEAKLDAQYGPQAVYAKLLDSAQKGGDQNPFNTAARGVIETGAVIAKPNPQTGEIALVNARNGELWRVLPNKDAYKAITGQDLYIPQGSPGRAATTPGNRPATVGAAAPATGPAAGMTQQGPPEPGVGIGGAGPSARQVVTNYSEGQLAAVTKYGPKSPLYQAAVAELERRKGASSDLAARQTKEQTEAQAAPTVF